MTYIPAAGGVTAAAAPPGLRQSLQVASAAAGGAAVPAAAVLLLSHGQHPPPPSQLLLRRQRARLPAGALRGRRETKPQVLLVPQTQACHGYCARGNSFPNEVVRDGLPGRSASANCRLHPVSVTEDCGSDAYTRTGAETRKRRREVASSRSPTQAEVARWFSSPRSAYLGPGKLKTGRFLADSRHWHNNTTANIVTCAATMVGGELHPALPSPSSCSALPRHVVTSQQVYGM